MLRALLLVGCAVTSLACTPPYGRQSCKSTSECPTGQQCPALCSQPDAGADAGPDPERMAICHLPCTTDADCGNLGLKKPVCAVYRCTGEKICTDNPF